MPYATSGLSNTLLALKFVSDRPIKYPASSICSGSVKVPAIANAIAATLGPAQYKRDEVADYMRGVDVIPIGNVDIVNISR